MSAQTKEHSLSVVIAIMLIAAMFFASADYAAASSISVASVSGKTCKLTNGITGIQYSAKSLKKGNAVKICGLSANSKYAKTIVYGKTHRWSSKTISKRLKKARNYKVSTEGWKFYSVKRGGKLRYIAYCKTAAQAPVNEISPSGESAKEQSAALNEGTLEISVTSDDTSFTSDDYDFSQLKMRISSGEGYCSVVSPDGEGDILREVPAGEYDVDIVNTCSEDRAFVFSSSTYAASVKAGEKTELDIVATPQPGYLYVYSADKNADRVLVTGSSGKTEELPFDTSGDCAGSEGLFGNWLPADDYLVVIESGGKVYESKVHLSPARYCSAIF